MMTKQRLLVLCVRLPLTTDKRAICRCRARVRAAR